MKRIIYSNPDNNGILAVICPAPGMKVKDCFHHVPAGVEYQVMPEEAIPSDRTFRNLWRMNGSGEAVAAKQAQNIICVDIEEAREFGHNCRRDQRDILMDPLDKKATIPGAVGIDAEQARESVRAQNALDQDAINAATNLAGIAAVINRNA